MQKAVGTGIIVAIVLALGALLYFGGVFSPASSDKALTGQAVAEREEPASAPEPPRPGRLQIFVADAETGEPVTEFEMRREPAPSVNWLENRSADGRFELSGALDRYMRLHFRADGYFPNHVDLFYANVPEDGVMKALTLQMQPGYVVTGTVIDDQTGEPIEGARIRGMAGPDVTEFENYTLTGESVLFDKTNNSGTFRLEVAPPSAGRMLVVWAEDYAVHVVEQNLEAPEKELEIRLQPGAHKSFRLVQSGGAVGPMHFRLDQPQTEGGAPPIALEATSRPKRPAELRYVQEGVYRAIIDVPGGGGEWGRAVVAVAQDEPNTVLWDVDEFGGIFGAVKEFSPDTPLVVSIVDARYPFVPIFESAPDSDGLFEFGFLPPGAYLVRVEIAGSDGAPEEKKYNVTNGEWREIDVDMPEIPAPAEAS